MYAQTDEGPQVEIRMWIAAGTYLWNWEVRENGVVQYQGCKETVERAVHDAAHRYGQVSYAADNADRRNI